MALLIPWGFGGGGVVAVDDVEVRSIFLCRRDDERYPGIARSEIQKLVGIGRDVHLAASSRSYLPVFHTKYVRTEGQTYNERKPQSP